MGRSIKIIYLLCVACVFSAYTFTHPIHNWDMIPYVASTYDLMGVSHESLLKVTYDDVRAAVSEKTFSDLTTGIAYREAVAGDAAALEAQLPLYRIRPLYIFAVYLGSTFTETVAQATWLVSAVSSGLLVFVSGLLFLRSPVLIFVSSPFLFGLSVALALGQLSTPDMLAVTVAVGMFALSRGAASSAALIGAMALIALLPAIRTDYVILSVLVAAFLYLSGGVRPNLLAAALACCCYLVVNYAAGNYGHLVIFNFTLIQGPQAFPGEMPISRDVSDYIGAYYRGVWRIVRSDTLWILMLVPAASLAMIDRLGRTELAFVFSAVLFVFVHFAAFPAAFDRTYVICGWAGVFVFFRALETTRLSDVKRRLLGRAHRVGGAGSGPPEPAPGQADPVQVRSGDRPSRRPA